MAERVVKIIISAALIAVFAAVGALVAGLKPFHSMGWRGGPFAADPGARSGPAAPLPHVPAPPEAQLSYRTTVPGGSHWRYESRLSSEGLRLFYTEQLPRQGWLRDRAFESAWRRAQPEADVLSFKQQGARCIIGFEEVGAFRMAVTVLVLNVSSGALPASRVFLRTGSLSRACAEPVYAGRLASGRDNEEMRGCEPWHSS